MNNSFDLWVNGPQRWICLSFGLFNGLLLQKKCPWRQLSASLPVPVWRDYIRNRKTNGKISTIAEAFVVKNPLSLAWVIETNCSWSQYYFIFSLVMICLFLNIVSRHLVFKNPFSLKTCIYRICALYISCSKLANNQRESLHLYFIWGL